MAMSSASIASCILSLNASRSFTLSVQNIEFSIASNTKFVMEFAYSPLSLNAVIFAHNPPSNVAEPSKADQNITRRLKDALALVDIRVLDHIVVGSDIVSFTERGLI